MRQTPNWGLDLVWLVVTDRMPWQYENEWHIQSVVPAGRKSVGKVESWQKSLRRLESGRSAVVSEQLGKWWVRRGTIVFAVCRLVTLRSYGLSSSEAPQSESPSLRFLRYDDVSS